MKISQIVLLASLLVAPLQAAFVAKNYEQAKPKLGKDGYIIVAYPDGWDKRGEKSAKRWLASEKVLNAAGDAVLIPLPVTQTMGDAEKAKQESILGKLQLPPPRMGPHTYPALYMMDKDGAWIALVHGAEMRKLSPSKMADRLAQVLQNARERKRLLEEAGKASGVAKARLLGKAAELSDLRPIPDYLKHLEAADLKDETGYVRRAKYNPWGFAAEMTKSKDPVAYISKLDAMLADKAYTDDQKQKMCATYIGALRRAGGPANLARIREMAEKMRAYAPGTAEARTVDVVVREWVREFGLDEGWSPEVLSSDDKEPLLLGGNISIPSAGTYELTFQYTSGTDQLNIAAVEFYDGDKKVAEDRHAGSTGIKNKNNVYTLKVTSAVASPQIKVYLAMKGKRNSHGSITLQKK